LQKSLFLWPFSPVTSYQTRDMAKKSTKKGKTKPTKQQNINDIIEELSDDEDDDPNEKEEDNFVIRETELSKLMSLKNQKKSVKGTGPSMKYQEFVSIINGESLWKDLESSVSKLKHVFINQLNVRSSTSLDEIPVVLEGDTYPLNEVASISKKDPKKLIIDASAFPQAAANIMKSIRDSGMNLNPQQDGLTIFVPIPKVNKEFREKLASGARKKLNECKDELRNIQNKYTKQISEKELLKEVAKDDAKAAVLVIKMVTDKFMSESEDLLTVKIKEIMGK